MPKVRRVRSPSIDCSRSSPYPSNSKNVELQRPMNLLRSVEDEKEWEEARCPICMEPPHNAVLLKCSSHEIGCRPYMCNTSHRHSNCLDQFCKSYASHLSSTILEEIPLTSTATRRSSEVQPESGHPLQHGSQLQPKLICPLCRGEIYGYIIVEPARRYMNSKLRSCSSETCEFQGTYSELRKHARSEHPLVRPSEVDPLRQHDWIRMEQERDLEDFLNSTQVSSGGEHSTFSFLTGNLSDLMSLFLYEIFSSIEEASRQMTGLLADSRLGVPVPDRRSGPMYRASGDTWTNRSARWRTNLSSMHEVETNHTGRGRSRTNLSSVPNLEANRRARWRTSVSSSRMPSDIHQYYRQASLRQYNREASPGPEIPSRAVPLALQQTSHNGSWRSSGRNHRGRQLRWRDQRWSMYNDQS